MSPTSQRAMGESDVYRTRRKYFVQEKCVDVEDSLEVGDETFILDHHHDNDLWPFITFITLLVNKLAEPAFIVW